MYKRFIVYPIVSVCAVFVAHTCAELLAERYECRKWYNFFNMSVHCYMIKRVSYLCEICLQDWIVATRKVWNLV